MTDHEAPGPSEAALAALETLIAVARRLDAAQRLEHTTDDPLLAAVTQTAAVVLEAQAASIAVHDPVRNQLVFVAAAGPSAGDVVGLRIDAAAGIAGYAFATGQPLAVADVATDPRFDRTVAETTGYVPRSLLATPLVDDQGTVGVLEILDRRDGTFSLRDLEIAGTLAREATVIVRRGRLERDAAGLLRGALIEIASLGEGPASPDAAAIDEMVAAVTVRLDADGDDPTWRLADRLARLVATDPDRIDLAIDWLDALLRRRPTGRR